MQLFRSFLLEIQHHMMCWQSGSQRGICFRFYPCSPLYLFCSSKLLHTSLYGFMFARKFGKFDEGNYSKQLILKILGLLNINLYKICIHPTQAMNKLTSSCMLVQHLLLVQSYSQKGLHTENPSTQMVTYPLNFRTSFMLFALSSHHGCLGASS